MSIVPFLPILYNTGDVAPSSFSSSLSHSNWGLSSAQIGENSELVANARATLLTDPGTDYHALVVPVELNTADADVVWSFIGDDTNNFTGVTYMGLGKASVDYTVARTSAPITSDFVVANRDIDAWKNGALVGGNIQKGAAFTPTNRETFVFKMSGTTLEVYVRGVLFVTMAGMDAGTYYPIIFSSNTPPAIWTLLGDAKFLINAPRGDFE